MKEGVTEKDMAKMQLGGRASVAMEYMDGKLNEQEARIVQSLKHAYRAGDLEYGKLLSNIAQLVTIEDVRTTMKSDIRMGQSTGAKNDRSNN
jgi:hypothetical protein